MAPEEYCAIGHIDMIPPILNAVELCELTLRGYVSSGDPTTGVLDLVALRQIPLASHFANHFEFVRRFRSEDAYLEHLSSPRYRALRAGVAWALGGPYEDRLHRVLDEKSWPTPVEGDFVTITELELQPGRQEQSAPLLERIAESQGVAPGLIGQLFLGRTVRQTGFELLSVWSSASSFDEHIGSDTTKRSRGELADFLMAPIDDRRYEVLGSGWTAPA